MNFDKINNNEEKNGWIEKLTKHHENATAIYQQTQPIIDEQNTAETQKYLKNQTNGTKVKSTRPRTAKRPRVAANSNSKPAESVSKPNSQEYYSQVQYQQQPIYQYSPMQQQTQPQYHQAQQPMYQQQQQQPIYQYSPMQQQSHHHYQQSQPVLYQPQPPRLQQNGYVHQSHYQVHNPLPLDLDLNLQGGLECDVDTVIKQEISYNGHLDFNSDLLLKLDRKKRL